ncbi:MAG: polyprenyl synthetase family protein [Lachnospiraceae bacterium]
MDFKTTLEQKTSETEEIVTSFLPEVKGYQKTVLDAMNYSFRAGGKRLRPLMMREIFSYYGGNTKVVEPFMAALEMIHTYSLVHDDLPEMDNDELRRGIPTTHIAYGQDMAVLAGDALLNYAFETALSAFTFMESTEEKERGIHALQILAKKAGIFGMIGGQTLDVEAEKKGISLDREAVLFVDEHKTAALLQAAMMIGGVLAGASAQEVAVLEEIGCYVGVAFQIQDDILDIVSTTEVLGKPVGSDDKNKKETYVSLVGLEQATKDQKEMSEKAMDKLDLLHGAGDISFMKALIRSLITREK